MAKARELPSLPKAIRPNFVTPSLQTMWSKFLPWTSRQTHPLLILGYDPLVPERVCLGCKQALLEQNLAERVAVSIS
jgi:hypothetical protein